MFTNNISQTLTPLQKTTAQGAITTLTGIFVWFLNLTPEDRKKILKMGDKSEAFVRAVLVGLQANPTVAGTLNLTEFAKDMQLWDDLKAFAALLTPFYEGLQDTMVLLSSELMQQANMGYGLIKEAAKTNSALTTLANDLGDRYQKAGPVEPTAFTLPASGTITLNGIVDRRQFKLLSGGPVTIFKGAFANGENKVVNIANPITLPKGWTTITTVNSNTVSPSIFLVAQE